MIPPNGGGLKFPTAPMYQQKNFLYHTGITKEFLVFHHEIVTHIKWCLTLTHCYWVTAQDKEHILDFVRFGGKARTQARENHSTFGQYLLARSI